MRVGIYDEGAAGTYFGPVDTTFATFKQLHVQEVRLNLYWGGPHGVATRRPAHATNPADPAYDWSLYDRTVRYGGEYGVHVLFTIYGTPSWANGGRAPNVAPKNPTDLRNFAFAAAKRYGGTWPDGAGGQLPPVAKRWLARNEAEQPDLPDPPVPPYRDRLDDAEPRGLREDLQRRLQRDPRDAICRRARRLRCHLAAREQQSVECAPFRLAARVPTRREEGRALKTFDAWAHHPYYSGPSDQPTTKPVTAKKAFRRLR